MRLKKLLRLLRRDGCLGLAAGGLNGSAPAPAMLPRLGLLEEDDLCVGIQGIEIQEVMLQKVVGDDPLLLLESPGKAHLVHPPRAVAEIRNSATQSRHVCLMQQLRRQPRPRVRHLELVLAHEGRQAPSAREIEAGDKYRRLLRAAGLRLAAPMTQLQVLGEAWEDFVHRAAILRHARRPALESILATELQEGQVVHRAGALSIGRSTQPHRAGEKPGSHRRGDRFGSV
mmetsp:Transcript_72365/g.172842  ORF Transcript_72365/g.172842 Transcript_72365/m.172842 type:complete len:229 (+) Transcript_72365:1182-1868(+)